MEKKTLTQDSAERELNLWNQLLTIPHYILQNHHLDGLAQLILLHLANPECFALQKAAYLIDNPDFNCLKGVTGTFENEALKFDYTWWQSAEKILEQTQKASIFHNRVRSLLLPSLKPDAEKSDSIQQLATFLEFDQQPKICSWPMKNNNRGILLYQPNENLGVPWKQNLLDNAVALLSLGGH